MLSAWTAYPPPSLPRSTISPTSSHACVRSMQLAGPLSAEDAMLQSMADASPSKWHLAHTTWFFERFVLAGFPAAPAHDPAWDYLFNSYYKSIGPAHARPQRPSSHGPRCSRCMTIASRSMHRCSRGYRQVTWTHTRCTTCSWACSTNNSIRSCC